MTSNKPYLIKAFYGWISDNQLTPYIAVDVNVYGVLVPMAYVADGQIVLNVSSSALGDIAFGDDAIEFSARFGGKLEHLVVPYGAISAIYAKENGAGTSLPIEHPDVTEADASEKKPSTLSAVTTEVSQASDIEKPKVKGKPSLKVIK